MDDCPTFAPAYVDVPVRQGSREQLGSVATDPRLKGETWGTLRFFLWGFDWLWTRARNSTGSLMYGLKSLCEDSPAKGTAL